MAGASPLPFVFVILVNYWKMPKRWGPLLTWNLSSMVSCLATEIQKFICFASSVLGLQACAIIPVLVCFSPCLFFNVILGNQVPWTLYGHQ